MYETDYITEIIFDADNKKINIKEDEYLILKDTFKSAIKSAQIVVDAICKISKKMFEEIKKYLSKKMTKKKFTKLLQSEGIQRNTINEIVKGNKEPYTYMRYYRTLQNFKK